MSSAKCALKTGKATLQEVASLRALFLQENNFQVRYNACHERGHADSYLLSLDGATIGYGSIKGQDLADRDTLFEFYVLPNYRNMASRACALLVAATNARYIECQSNHPLLCSLLYEYTRNIRAAAVLFADHAVTQHVISGAVVRERRDNDQVFTHAVEPLGDFVVDVGGEVVATGGFLTHYNPPFADLYMEVEPASRRRGYGSLVIQEVKKACYLAGRVPAARCNIENKASWATLVKAGLQVVGFMLIGGIHRNE